MPVRIRFLERSDQGRTFGGKAEIAPCGLHVRPVPPTPNYLRFKNDAKASQWVRGLLTQRANGDGNRPSSDSHLMSRSAVKRQLPLVKMAMPGVECSTVAQWGTSTVAVICYNRRNPVAAD
jgi:hypothetical protein